MLLFISARGSDAIAARLPPSSRAGRRGDKEKMCFSSIETLSREISHHSAARTIEGWDFTTSLRCGRNDVRLQTPDAEEPSCRGVILNAVKNLGA